MLKDDHRSVEKLFKQFEDAGDRAFVEKRKVVDRIIEELSIHAAVEEQFFYPVTRATVPAVEDVALESLEEHHIVKWVLSELERMDPEDERFDAKVTVLIENVRHHVEEEEGEYFPAVRDELGPQGADRARRRHGVRQEDGPDAPAPPLARHPAGQPRRRRRPPAWSTRSARRCRAWPRAASPPRRISSIASWATPSAAVPHRPGRALLGRRRRGSAPGRARPWTGWWRPCRPPSPAARTSPAPCRPGAARTGRAAASGAATVADDLRSGAAQTADAATSGARKAGRRRPAAGPGTRPGRHGRPCARQAAPHEPAPARRDGPPRAPRRHRRRRPPSAPRRRGRRRPLTKTSSRELSPRRRVGGVRQTRRPAG